MYTQNISVTPRLYGRRKGRPLRARKSQLVQEFLPRVRIDLPADNSHFIDPHRLFVTRYEEIWLEIGFGGGEHLASQAVRNPDTGFIGCEPFINGVAGLLDHIDRNSSQNIRVFPNDARPLLDALPDSAIDRCFILFADPWPKARHAQRRFINQENLARLARVLKPGAELRLATDDAGLAVWMREQMKGTSDFQSVYDGFDPPQDWVETRYEQKGRKAGRRPAYMCWRRR